MKLSKDYLNDQLSGISKQKEAEWIKRFPFPVPPTDKEVIESLKRNEFKIGLPKCGCSSRATWDGYADASDLKDFFHGSILEKFHVACEKHKAKRKVIRDAISKERGEVFKAIYYGGATPAEALKELARFEKWRP